MAPTLAMVRRSGAAAFAAALGALLLTGCGNKMEDGGADAAVSTATPAPLPSSAPPQAQKAAAEAQAQTQYMNQRYNDMGKAQNEARAKAGR